MNSKYLFFSVLLAGLCASASVPTVSNVTTVQNASRRVSVNYTLSGEPGIVTLSVQTNRGDGVWVDVDDANLTYVSGDVNKCVAVGDHSLAWRPDKSWPDQFITGGNIRIGVKAWSLNAPPDYMVVSLVAANAISFYTCAAAIPNGGVTNDLYKTEYLVMRKIPAANVTWRMGSPTTENLRNADNEVPHEVVLTNDYYIGVYPVTQRQYELLMDGARPSYFRLAADYATRPVEQVSYADVRGSGYAWPQSGHNVGTDSFIDKLRRHAGVDGFDLPKDAQWEFACRAGCGAALYNGQELDAKNSPSRADALARHKGNGGFIEGKQPGVDSSAMYGSAKVGTYPSNDWGLYDMLGNVWERCLDRFQASLEGCDGEVAGPTSGGNHVLRGGSWMDTADQSRCANRSSVAPSYQGPHVGFRLACSALLQ